MMFNYAKIIGEVLIIVKQLIHNDWWEVLKPQFESTYYAQLHNFLKEEYTHQTIYPEMHHIFEAFEWTPFSKVKVVILGQDPYHGPNQAHGCSFSVLPGVPVPPSLQNIYKELQRSEERRVGKECVSTCRSRWSPYH